jgi:hypothetical protein
VDGHRRDRGHRAWRAPHDDDIDATVRGDQADVGSLVKALAKKRIVPRIGNAERFASESLVLLLRHGPTGVEFDVSMAWTSSPQLRIDDPQLRRSMVMISSVARGCGRRLFVPGTFTHCRSLKRQVPVYVSL